MQQRPDDARRGLPERSTRPGSAPAPDGPPVASSGRSCGSARVRRAAALAALLVATSCGVRPGLNPVTKTPELMVMSAERERTIGRRIKEELEQQIGLVRDEAMTRYVEEIGGRIADQSPRRDLVYTFHVLDDPVPNAFAIPGGFVYITRGMLALAQSEDQVAGVLGHQIAHAAARDLTGPGLLDRAISGLGLLLAIGGGPSLGSLVEDGVMRPRLNAEQLAEELQADRVSQDMVLAAGFDPATLPDLLRSLAREQELHQTQRPRRSVPFPDLRYEITNDRIDAAAQHAAEIGGPTAPIPVRDSYLAIMLGMPLDQDATQGLFVEDSVFLQADLDLRVQFPEEWRQTNAATFVGARDGGFVFIKVELQDPDPDDLPKGTTLEAFDGRDAAKAYFKAEAARIATGRGEEKSAQDDFVRTRSGRALLSKGQIAYRVEGTIANGQGTVYMYWVKAGDHMYRLTCTMATQLRGNYAQDCLRVARSIRTLRPTEREQIYQITLAVAETLPNETLPAFSDRVNNAWSVEETAAANGLSLPYALDPGQPVKYAKRELYRGAPPAPPAPVEDAEAAPPAPSGLPETAESPTSE